MIFLNFPQNKKCAEWIAFFTIFPQLLLSSPPLPLRSFTRCFVFKTIGSMHHYRSGSEVFEVLEISISNPGHGVGLVFNIEVMAVQTRQCFISCLMSLSPRSTARHGERACLRLAAIKHPFAHPAVIREDRKLG